ncbi:MAG: DUF3558 domain-containing protein [Mycobacteriaceae bacterium]|nr:DUF3558 domain-containing protein [Mycobacteriaceae bacterium]
MAATAAALALAACGPHPAHPQTTQTTRTTQTKGFHSGECNKVSDDEVNHAALAGMFTKVVDSDAGCFWQENTLIGSFGAGMGISTWWYRGSDMDAERTLEIKAGRRLTEMTVAGNKGFQASDTNACSIYVAKDNDVITWSIQTLNPASLPDLCTITQRLARLTQGRVN